MTTLKQDFKKIIELLGLHTSHIIECTDHWDCNARRDAQSIIWEYIVDCNTCDGTGDGDGSCGECLTCNGREEVVQMWKI